MASKRESPNVFSKARELILRKIRDDSVPSIGVAVARHGDVLWSEGFGWADRERRIAANEHTMYSLASISKPVTATGLMVLVQRGVIDLDKPVNDYLGDAKVNGRCWDASEATVRRVANHSSGLPLHFQFFYADERYHRPPMDETIRRYANLIRPPGERYQYTNLGYGILDAIVERHGGEPFADFMRSEVFIPLGLTHTSVDIGPGLQDFAAQRYGEDGVAYPFYDFDHPGASAVFSSAHDLVRFGMFHLKNRSQEQKEVLTEESIDAMQTGTAEMSKGWAYGIGWAMGSNDRGLKSAGHNGGMGGVSTVLKLFPEEGLVVVVLTNSESDAPYRVTEEIMAALSPTYAERLAADREKRENQSSESEEDAIRLPTGKWEGTVHTYKGDLPFWLEFKDSGDVHAKVGDSLVALVNDLSFEDDNLSGQFLGDLNTEDVARTPNRLVLDLKMRGDVLNGGVMAVYSMTRTGGAPGKRLGNALTHWAELRRVE